MLYKPIDAVHDANKAINYSIEPLNSIDIRIYWICDRIVYNWRLGIKLFFAQAAVCWSIK